MIKNDVFYTCWLTLVTMFGVKVGQHYFLKFNAHVVNEKFYVAKGLKTMFDVNHSWCSSIFWQEEEDCVVCINISFNHGHPMTKYMAM